MRTVLKQYRRFFRRSPLVASLASFVLAAGFAGSTLAYAVMLAMMSPKPNGMLPMQYSTIAEEASGNSQSVTWKTYERLRASAGWSDPVLLAYAEPIRAMLFHQQAERGIAVAAVSKGFFAGFMEQLDAGQDFSFSGENASGAKEIILSRRLADSLFSSPGDALDHNLIINGQSFRVIGVAPGNFSGLWSSTDAWVPPSRIVSLDLGEIPGESHPAGSEHSSTLDRPEVWQKFPIFYVLAGSRRISSDHLRNKLQSLVQSPDNLPSRLQVTDGLSKDPMEDMKVRYWARLAFLLSIALIIAAGLNYCGLLLAQAPHYLEEVRLKRVLGAGVPRILLENLCGPMCTVLLGFLIAACIAVAGIVVLAKQESYLPLTHGIAWLMVLKILGVELAGASLWGGLIALVPSVRLLRDSGAPRMGYTTTSNRKVSLALSAIVACQMASCIVICLVAGMIMSAVHSISKVALGFESDHLTAVEIGPASKDTPIEFSTAANSEFPLATFVRQVLETAQMRLSGTRYISAASCAPLAQRMRTISIQRMDRELPSRSIHFCGVSQEFFQTMGDPIVAGRGFSTNRFTGNVTEVVINRRLADDLWQGEDPLHHTVRVEEPAWELRFVAEVVGVAQDMRFSGLTSTPDATVFLPLKGNVFTLSLPLYFLARGPESPRSVEEIAQRQAAITMPTLGVNSSFQIDAQLQQSFMEQKARVWFSAIGAGLVAVIAYIGLYGVLVHSVNSRQKEMAIRACFGASAGDLRKIIFSRAVQCSVAAIAMSLLAWRPIVLLASTAWLGRVEFSWQLGVAIPFLCLAVALGISMAPAAIAANVSPAGVLKEE